MLETMAEEQRRTMTKVIEHAIVSEWKRTRKRNGK